MSLENENMNESQARDAARREYIEKFTWHDDAVIAAYVEENWRRIASEKPAMTIPPADDEQIAAMEECLDGRTVWDDDHIARLIARIRAETEWQPIETAPKDGTWFYAYRPKSKVGTWDRIVIVRWLDAADDFVWPDETFDIFEADLVSLYDDGFGRLDYYEGGGSFTHWRPLPTPPALSQEERT